MSESTDLASLKDILTRSGDEFVDTMDATGLRNLVAVNVAETDGKKNYTLTFSFSQTGNLGKIGIKENV